MIRPWTPGSLSIDASAGYGKTQRLCARLLAHFLTDGDATRNTVALTFTKPAAGEIYARMLQMLSSALLDDGKLRELRDALPPELREVSPDELHGLLERLIRDMGKLNISTIDSFFYRLVRVFAMELGMPGRVELDESGGESPVTETLLCELFSGSRASDELLGACRISRIGDEKKTFFNGCLGLLKLAQSFRDKRTSPDFWGGGFGEFSAKSREALQLALEKCEKHPWPAKYETTLGPLLRRCASAADHPENCHFTKDEKNTLRTFLTVWKDFPNTAPAGFLRGWNYDDVAPELRLLLGNGLDVLMYQCVMRTRGLRTLLNEYHRIYEERMLRRGRINFADLPLLLAADVAAPESASEFLNEISYRTNSRFKHVLIDEFQDTSRAQWNVLDPIASDNGEGDHSLFIVGDVKQAIYGWREGDSKLMGEVTSKRKLKPDPLKLSYRYGPVICQGLNRLFGDLDSRRAAAEREDFEPSAALPELIAALDGVEPGIPVGTFASLAKRWTDVFQLHDTARKARPGEFEVLALMPTSERCNALRDPRPEEESPNAVFSRMILERLERVEFFSGKKSVTAALLVRDGGNGIRLRDELRRAAPEFADRIIWEGNECIVNDPLVSSLLDFGVWLQHPADTMAREGAALNLLLRSLVPELLDGGEKNPGAAETRLRWLTLLAERGIAGFFRETLKRLAARARSMTDDAELAGWTPIENGDMDELLALADTLDGSGSPRDMSRFRTLAAAKRKKAVAVAGKLQIMTIHHSKGLTFDLVFHPMFRPAKAGTGNWRGVRNNVTVTGGPWSKRFVGYELTEEEKKREDQGADPQWLVNAPREEGMTFPVIAGAVIAMHADSCFEELCDLYVALTRARYGMYVLLPQRGKAKTAAYSWDWAAWTLDKDTGEWKIPEQTDRRPVSRADNSCYISDLVFDAFFDDLPDAPGKLPVVEQSGVPCLRRVFGQELSPEKLSEKPAPAKRKLVCSFADAGKRPGLDTPSDLDETRRLRFTLPSEHSGVLLGTRVHAFFEGIGRWCEFEAPADTPAEVLAHYDACKENADLVRLLDEECELWRERRFDVVLTDPAGNRALVSGCFDRVQIVRGPGGGVVRACIIDYKSNQAEESELPTLAEHYAPQLETYRKALAVLLGVTPNVISCRIVFTRYGAVVAV